MESLELGVANFLPMGCEQKWHMQIPGLVLPMGCEQKRYMQIPGLAPKTTEYTLPFLPFLPLFLHYPSLHFLEVAIIGADLEATNQ